MTSRHSPLAVTLILVLLSLRGGIAWAQGGSDTDPRFEKLAKDLYPKAKQEGALVVYTIWDVEHIKSILDVFNKRFPGINTTYWQGTRSEIIARTLTEFQGDQKTADVILSEGAPVVLRAAGAIEPYNTVQANSLILHDPRASHGEPCRSSLLPTTPKNLRRKTCQKVGRT